MALVAKTAYYAWNTATASLNPATNTGQQYIVTGSLGFKQLYFPETTNRVFESVGLEVGFRQGLSTAFDITNITASVQLEGASPQNFNIAGATNTGEHISVVFSPFELATYFNNNFPAASSSLSCSVQIFALATASIAASSTGSLYRNFTSKLFATYEHEDTDTTYLKTAIIPFNSPTGSIPSTFTTFGTIPALTGSDGFLPEADVVIRDYFFEIEGNEQAVTSTDLVLRAQVSSSIFLQNFTWGTIESALASDTYDRYIWTIPTSSLPDIAASHSWQMNLNTGADFNNIPSTLYVTYEYNKTNTTRLLNTLLVPQYIQSPVGNTTSVDASYAARTFKVLENNLNLKQSALRFFWGDIANVGDLNIKVGTQNYTPYTTNGSSICGGKVLQHLIDDGITLTRGDNTLELTAFATSTVVATNVNGLYIINYHSDIPSNGIDYATKYHLWVPSGFGNFQNAGAINNRWTETIPFSSNITSSAYIVGHGYQNYSFGSGVNGITLTADKLANELNGIGYVNLYDDALNTDSEVGTVVSTLGFSDAMGKYNEAPPSTYINPWATRLFRYFQNNSAYRAGFTRFVTLSRFTTPISGSVFGYSGDGSGLSVDIFNASNDVLLFTLTTTTGGLFNTQWYDNTNLMYARVVSNNDIFYSQKLTSTSSLNVYVGNFEYGFTSTN
jgi:hypothetical protein